MNNTTFFRRVAQSNVPEYARIYFDNLNSEYGVLEAAIKDEALKRRLEEIRQRRQNGELTWNDVYEFDLALLSVMQPKDLVRKAYDMRARYRSIAGAKDYDAYVASKPPDLTTLDTKADKETPDTPVVTVETLRADVRYLLKQFYLYYALLPYREGFRDELTRRARNTTYVIIGILVILIALGYGLEANSNSVVIVVVFSGVIGGCMSMLQRIQSAPTEGDSLYNLSALENGWKGISLSPLYGAIFAILLFILFSAGILKGTIFPVIETERNFTDAVKQSNEGKSTGPKSTAGGKTIQGQATGAKDTFNAKTAVNANAANNNQAQTLNVNDNSNANTAVSNTSSPQEQTADKKGTLNQNSQAEQSKKQDQRPVGISFNDFLGKTYPDGGVSYALLVVWSFIAGFAERLVPDTLNRLVTKNASIQGTNQ